MKHKTIVFEDDFDLPSTNRLISELNSVDDESVSLFISGPGGAIAYKNIIAHTINRMDNIVVYPFGACQSATSELILNDITVPIIIDQDCEVFMFHACDRYSRRIRTEGELDYKEMLKIDKSTNVRSLKWMKDILTPEDIQVFKDGKDVYLYASKFKSQLSKFKSNIKVK